MYNHCSTTKSQDTFEHTTVKHPFYHRQKSKFPAFSFPSRTPSPPPEAFRQKLINLWGLSVQILPQRVAVGFSMSVPKATRYGWYQIHVDPDAILVVIDVVIVPEVCSCRCGQDPSSCLGDHKGTRKRDKFEKRCASRFKVRDYLAAK